MKSIIFVIQCLVFLMIGSIDAQVVISETAVPADSSAIFEIKSSDKGFLPPRMTMGQRDSITNPADGLTVYCIDCKELQIYTDSTWTNMLGELPKNTFTCGDSLLHAGQYYSTLLIGSQCWFAENLNIGTRVDLGTQQLNNNIIEKQCYNNDSINCDIYGGLYRYGEMMNYQILEPTQGICPDGWHIPSDYEFINLELTLGMSLTQSLGNSFRGMDQGSQLAGTADLWAIGALKANPAFDSSGFNAVPGGFTSNNSYSLLGSSAYFWTSSVLPGGNQIFFRHISKGIPAVERKTISSNFSFSVRCVQD